MPLLNLTLRRTFSRLYHALALFCSHWACCHIISSRWPHITNWKRYIILHFCYYLPFWNVVVFSIAAAASSDEKPKLLEPTPFVLTVLVGISFFSFNALNLYYVKHFAGGVTNFMKIMNSFYESDFVRSELEALSYLYLSSSPLLFFVGVLLLLTLVCILALIKGGGKGPNRPL
uniref:NADH dehydrogenase subunit 6 n=1 Tax=Callanthias japonicus TaxID=270594 RepID=A0A1V1FJE7_9TELE|nr:NADH dehydrogenase subunit 6 [Callanthias japonicus]BBU25863.1 NADH dehydrogenase subunit 6 [Callanthias japonicus]